MRYSFKILFDFFRYHIKEKEAEMFEKFLLPMLEYYPTVRATAKDCLKHSWLKMAPKLDFRMNEAEIEEYFKQKQKAAAQVPVDDIQLENEEFLDSDINDADGEDNDDVEDNISDTEFYGEPKNKLSNKLIDRSFTNMGYIGYGDGLNLEELDQTANWQFDEFNK